ncbi:HAD family hydrolase [Saccharibacter floricola]|uniref:phosphoglycolate phosphatase n=1 Tax=Saccharibacter floricola DSM 15669 TaxID=1123227 RepID=A0ABQ0P376_9PROT|nr:HAD family hydrolase [Saccharibacter floricola]GBQ07611.1 phosphoglycolate phosphatase [Saccharibacter floricola DSM 15669]
MPRFPVLLLDYDGTLAETRPAILRSLSEAFADQGLTPPSPETLGRQLGRGGTLKEFYQAMVSGSTAEEGLAFAAAYRKHYIQADLEETHLYDGVHEVLDALVKRGHQLVVLSNKHAPTLGPSLERFDLKKYLTAFMGAEDDKPRKPQKEVLTERVRPLFPNVPISDFLMVGDTTADLGFSRNTGIASCWASYGHSTEEAIASILTPDYRIDRLSELLDVLS